MAQSQSQLLVNGHVQYTYMSCKQTIEHTNDKIILFLTRSVSQEPQGGYDRWRNTATEKGLFTYFKISKPAKPVTGKAK